MKKIIWKDVRNNIGCYLIFIEFVLYIKCMCAYSIKSDSLQLPGLQPTRLLCPWNFPGKNTGLGCHFHLQGISPIQGSNLHLLCLLCWQVNSLPLSYLGNPTKCILIFNFQAILWSSYYCFIIIIITIIISILHLRKLSLREIKSLPQDHPVSNRNEK